MKDQGQAVRADQSGSISVIMAVTIIALLGLAALVVDLGHIYSVRREMQKAAEAGALAGARGLAPWSAGHDPSGCLPPWNWNNGLAWAIAAVKANHVDGTSLSDYTGSSSPNLVQLGYWDSSTAHFQPYANPPPAPSPTQTMAVRVTVAKIAGGTGSSAPVSNFFAPILGNAFKTTTLQASAVAILPSASMVGARDCFPLAIPQNYAASPWLTAPTIQFGSGSGPGSYIVIPATSTYTIRDLMGNDQPLSLQVGYQIYIKPLVQDPPYGVASNEINQTYMLAVVGSNATPNTYTPIVGFEAFKIIAANSSSQYIQGHFSPGYIAPTSSGFQTSGKDPLAPVTQPKLVQ